MPATHPHKAASSIAASILAVEVSRRKVRFGPADLEQRAITEALCVIVQRLRLCGLAGEKVEEKPRKRKGKKRR